ncbi:unnamed protein product [Heligmosomoides polygyrus]|uniref:Uncharacterized protein n=1 Tax=Heligmosomoides polygyrus TaxID=6339 RepID=A0A183G817_HELPZ|nr:unnamed protein product [Heligmosomoides polygyrus]
MLFSGSTKARMRRRMPGYPPGSASTHANSPNCMIAIVMGGANSDVAEVEVMDDARMGQRRRRLKRFVGRQEFISRRCTGDATPSNSVASNSVYGTGFAARTNNGVFSAGRRDKAKP